MPEPPSSYGRDLLRRSVLVLMTAILVSRPLVLGEDPNFSADVSYLDPATLVLSLLTLCTAAAWAGWRLWSKHSTWYAGIVEIGLLLIVVGSFASTPVASNKHAAWLVSWEWLVLLVGFSTLRQLAVTRAELQGFLTALLATVVALAFYGGYQAAVEIPASQIRMQAEEKLWREMRAQGEYAPDPDAPGHQAMRERVEDGHAYGPYAHPNSFAGYLVLFVPALFGAAWLARHRGRPYQQRMLLLVFAVVAVIALYLTHSRGAMLGLLIAGVLVAGFAGRQWLAQNPLYILVSIVGVVALGYGVIQFGTLTKALNKNTETMAVRLEYWSATGKMLAERPWLGVGAGNFGTAYPKYMAASSAEKIKDPHNLFLDLWANAGLLGLVGLLVVVFGFLWRQWQLVREPQRLLEEKPPTPEEEAAEPDVRWEFYVGGAIGLLLAFALKMIGHNRDEIIVEGIVASVRTVIWFVAFGLLERVTWPPRLRSVLLTAGVLALLGNLFVSGGIGYPAVSFLLLAVMALALNSPLPRPVAVAEKYDKVARAVPFPALFALCLVYMATVFYPAAHSSAVMSSVRMSAAAYEQDQNGVPLFSERKVPNRWYPFQGQSFNPAFNYVRERLVLPLTQASDTARWDPRLPAEVARWSLRMWEMRPTEKELSDKVLTWATAAQRRDPASGLGYHTEADLREKFAQYLESVQSPGPFLGNAYRVFVEERGPLTTPTGSVREKIRGEYQLAAEALERFQPNDPTDAPLAFRIAELHARGDDRANMVKWGQLALKLNETARGRMRSLSDPQRTLLQRWLNVEPAR